MRKGIVSIFKLTLILTMMIGVSLAQSNSAEGELVDVPENIVDISISYEETISKRLISSHDVGLASWTIVNSNNQAQLAQGMGEMLFEYVFEEPGSYEIDFTLESHDHSDGCSHNDLPKMILLNVSASAISYLLEDVTLSKEIMGGESVEGITLSVPVEVKNFNDEQVDIPSNVYSSGVKSSIQGRLDENQQVLSKGNYTLTYNLSGSALKDTYISFDFEDTNGNVQTYYHLQQIK